MARMVRSNKYPEGAYYLPPMPTMAIARYQIALGNRLKTFPPNTEEHIRIPQFSTMESGKFQHLLRYDAESVFWCLLWWCIQAKPENQPEEASSLIYQMAFMGLDDRRDAYFIRSFHNDFLHSSYGKLYGLLDDMREHLQGDLDFSKSGDRTDPEYIHEVFQRLILNFLDSNRAQGFMDLQKAEEPRSLEMALIGGMLPASSIKRLYSAIADNDDPKVSIHCP